MSFSILDIELTYEDMVQFLQDGLVDLDEFVRCTEDSDEYECWLKEHGYTGIEREASEYLAEKEAMLYL